MSSSSETETTEQKKMPLASAKPEPTKKGKKGKKAVKAKPTGSKKKRRHKPKDFPKRPLSAYNIFFKETREKILSDNEGKKDIAFQTMAKEIASRWKELEPEARERVDSLAKQDMKRYREEVKNYEEEMVKRSRKEREESENLRRVMQEAEKAEAEQKASSEAAAAAGVASANGMANATAGLTANGANFAGQPSLEQLQALGGGLELDAVRREQVQMRLLEELRAVEARAMQVRQLQAQLGLPTNDSASLGQDLLQGLQQNSVMSSLAREPAMSDLLLRAGLAAQGGFGQNAGGLPPGFAGLLNMQQTMGNLGGLNGLNGLNAGLLSQVQGFGGLQGQLQGQQLQGLGLDQNADIAALLQYHAKQNAANAPF